MTCLLFDIVAMQRSERKNDDMHVSLCHLYTQLQLPQLSLPRNYFLFTARVIALNLLSLCVSRRFIDPYLFTLYKHASSRSTLHLGIRPCRHSRLLLYVYLLYFPSPARTRSARLELTTSIHNLPNSLIPFNPIDNL
jgi:hypothetical protein